MELTSLPDVTQVNTRTCLSGFPDRVRDRLATFVSLLDGACLLLFVFVAS